MDRDHPALHMHFPEAGNFPNTSASLRHLFPAGHFACLLPRLGFSLPSPREGPLSQLCFERRQGQGGT